MLGILAIFAGSAVAAPLLILFPATVRRRRIVVRIHRTLMPSMILGAILDLARIASGLTVVFIELLGTV